jgi:hypothetical protein
MVFSQKSNKKDFFLLNLIYFIQCLVKPWNFFFYDSIFFFFSILPKQFFVVNPKLFMLFLNGYHFQVLTDVITISSKIIHIGGIPKLIVNITKLVYLMLIFQVLTFDDYIELFIIDFWSLNLYQFFYPSLMIVSFVLFYIFF